MDQESHEPQVLDHNFDGIQEYDNPTPGWWNLIFYGAMVFSVLYVLFFNFSPYGWTAQYQMKWQKAAMEKRAAATVAASYGSLEPTQSNLMRLSVQPAAIAAAKKLFSGRCAACHTQNGGGLVGPNLTDNVAKDIKMPEDVYKVISKGVPGTAMIAWEPQLGKDNCALLAAYVISLRGTNVQGGKAPEGEPMPAWPAPPAAQAPNGNAAAGDGEKTGS